MGSERLLVLGHSPRGINFENVYRDLEQRGAKVIILNKSQLKSFSRFCRALKTENYNKLLIDLPFKYNYQNHMALAQLGPATFYEEDACQDQIRTSKWLGAFSTFYKSQPAPRIVNTGYQTQQHFLKQGFDSHFVAKGFDESRLSEIEDADRDIALGFIGRLKSGAYSQRAEMLHKLERDGLQLLRTDSSDDYLKTLNRIAIFVSADIGLGEYMAKNFEAMACGCAVLAWRQGGGEEEALGLIDMHNIALYSSYDEALEKITLLKSDDNLRQKIARNAKVLVNKNHRYANIAERLFELASSHPQNALLQAPKGWRSWLSR